jgi:hypothetical protein
MVNFLFICLLSPELRKNVHQMLLARDENGWTVVHHLSLLENSAALALVASSVHDSAYLDLPERGGRGRTPIMLAGSEFHHRAFSHRRRA